MRFTNSLSCAALAGFFSLGIVACHNTATGSNNSPIVPATLPTTVPPTQTGSNLPRHAYVDQATKLEDERREDEKKEQKAKRKTEKSKPTPTSKSVDEDYVPRGGFR